MPITRWDPWERGTDLAVKILEAELVDDDGVPIAPARVTSLTALVAVAGDAQPPAPLGGRTPVALVHDVVARRWRGVLAYDGDLDALDAVRVVVTATIEGRTARPLEAEARFALADGA